MLQKINATIVWRAAGALLLTAALSVTACGGGTASTGQLNTGTTPTPEVTPANPAPAADNNQTEPTPAPATPANTTSAFGIPAGLMGTVDAGNAVWSSNCTVCHGSMGAKTFAQIQAAMGRAPMTSLGMNQQQLADLTAYLNRGSIPAPAPAPDPAPAPAPTPDPAPAPASAPAPATDTTTAFGIPAGLTGSVSAGTTVWSNTCTACHGSMGDRSFGQLQSASGNSAMKSLNLNQQQLADLTAYLNRANIQSPGTPPAPSGGGSVGDDDEGDDDGSEISDDDGDDGASADTGDDGEGDDGAEGDDD